MPGIAVKDLDSAGGTQTATPGQTLMTLDDKLVVVVGAKVTPHGIIPLHILGPEMVTGVDWFTIEGIPVCREGDAAACGHTTTGRDWFQING